MTQLVTCITTLTSTGAASQYFIPGSGHAISTEANQTCPVRVNATLQNLVVKLFTNPGAGHSHTVSVRVNGVNTALAATVSDTTPNLTTTNTANQVSVVVGDTIVIEDNHTATTATSVFVQFELVGTECGHWNRSNVNLSTTTTEYLPIFGGAGPGAEDQQRSIVCAAGTLTSYRVNLSAAPGIGGSGKSRTFQIRLNGVSQDGTGGTTDTRVTISETATTGTWTGTLAVAEGDLIGYESTVANTPAASLAFFGASYQSTTTGEFNMTFQFGGAPSATAVEYMGRVGSNANNSWNPTETTVEMPVGPSGLVLSVPRAYLPTNPGAAKSFTFNVRRSEADPAAGPSVTVGSGQQATVITGTGSVTLSSSQTWNWKSTPSGTPSVGTYGQLSLKATTYAGPAGSCVMNGFSTTDDHMAVRGDMMSAMRQYLQCLYCTSNPDLAPLTERYRQERTATDSTDVWDALRDAAYGLETS